MPTKLEVNSRLIKPPHNDSPERPNFLEKFEKTLFRFALQKDGELTSTSLRFITQAFGESENEEQNIPKKGQLVGTIADDQVGLLLTRNKSICQLVSTGAADAGIVGLDQLYESGLHDKLIVAQELKELGAWDIVLATPKDRNINSVQELKVVATQYPVIAQAFFNLVGHLPEIVISQGSTEILPYLKYNGQLVDGIVDLRATGKTLANHYLEAWEPPITSIYPVLIVNPNSATDPSKSIFIKQLTAINPQSLK